MDSQGNSILHQDHNHHGYLLPWSWWPGHISALMQRLGRQYEIDVLIPTNLRKWGQPQQSVLSQKKSQWFSALCPTHLQQPGITRLSLAFCTSTRNVRSFQTWQLPWSNISVWRIYALSWKSIIILHVWIKIIIDSFHTFMQTLLWMTD